MHAQCGACMCVLLVIIIQNVVITTHGLLLFKPIKLLNTPSPLLFHDLML